MTNCEVGVCSSPVHCAEIGRCFSAAVRPPKAVMMFICEVPHLLLRLNRPYIFMAHPNCVECQKHAEQAKEAYGDER